MEQGISINNHKLLDSSSNPALIPATNQEDISYSSLYDCSNYHNNRKRIFIKKQHSATSCGRITKTTTTRAYPQ